MTVLESEGEEWKMAICTLEGPRPGAHCRPGGGPRLKAKRFAMDS